jgi:hypothetical protein
VSQACAAVWRCQALFTTCPENFWSGADVGFLSDAVTGTFEPKGRAFKAWLGFAAG